MRSKVKLTPVYADIFLMYIGLGCIHYSIFMFYVCILYSYTFNICVEFGSLHLYIFIHV